MKRISAQDISRSPFEDSPTMQALIAYSSDLRQDLISTTYGNFASQITELFQRELQDYALAIKFINQSQNFNPHHSLNEPIPSYDIYRLVDETMEIVSAELRNRMQHQIDSTSVLIASTIGELGRISLNIMIANVEPYLTPATNASRELILAELGSSREFELDDLELSQIGSDHPVMNCILTDAQSRAALSVLQDLATQPIRTQAHVKESQIRKEIQALLWVDRDMFDAAWKRLKHLS